MKRWLSAVMATVMLVTFMSVLTIPTAAAETTADIVEQEAVTLQNVKTGQYLNYDYGVLKNGQPVRVWPWDGSSEQRFDLVRVKKGVWRLLTNASSAYAVDIYRGNAKLKAGQLCDIWRAGSDATAQDLVLYRCEDGSYILRMSKNPALALAATTSKGRVKLVKFQERDNAQKWIFRDSAGKAIDITEKKPRYLPTNIYSLSEICRVDGVYYSMATTNQSYNGMPAGTVFYVNSESGAVVTDAAILGKILTVRAFNDNRETFCRMMADRVTLACEYLDEYTDIKGVSKLGNLIGKGAATYVHFLKLYLAKMVNADEVKDALKTTASFLSEAVGVKERLEIQVVMHYVEETVNSGIAARDAALGAVTDYDVLCRIMEDYAACEAAMTVVEVLAKETITSYNQKSFWEKLADGSKDALSELANGVAGGLFEGADALVDLYDVLLNLCNASNSVTENIKLVNQGAKIAINCIKGGEIYQGAYHKVLASADAIRVDGSAMAESTEALLSCNWDALVGKTVANIKDGKSYTKWYGEGENISARAGYIGQCTWYVLGRFYEVTGVKLTKAPHAKSWLTAQSSHKSVQIVRGAKNIQPQSIAVNTKGTYGHVLFVEHVEYSADGNPLYVYFTECNMDNNGTYNAGKDCILQKMTYKQFVSKRNPAGYITATNQ